MHDLIAPRLRDPIPLSLPTIPIMSAQELSLLQEEARQIIQEMEKQELELFIKTERAAGKKGWYWAWVLFLLSCFLLV
jgi:predicted metal-binding protein